MALEDATQGEGKKFFSLFNGEIKTYVDKETPGAKERINKQGTKVYEKFYRSISGIITGITKKVHDEYGKSWVIDLVDGEDKYSLQIPYSSRQADGLLRRLPNVKIEKNVQISCGNYDERAYLTLKQDGDKVEYFWTRENPGKLPEMVQVELKGELVWDDTKKMVHLEGYVNEHFMPKVTIQNEEMEAALPAIEQSIKPEAAKAAEEETDDLPF